MEIRELILKLNREKQITVLISSHILDELSRLATHYGIIDNGRMVKELSAEELDTVCPQVCPHGSDRYFYSGSRVLDSMNLEYKIISRNNSRCVRKDQCDTADRCTGKGNCEVLSMQEKMKVWRVITSLSGWR